MAATSPGMKYVRLDAALRPAAPRTRRDPRSERWISSHICCHRNRACSGKWAPRQPPGTGHCFGSLTGRRGWSAAGSSAEGSHKTARCDQTEENFSHISSLITCEDAKETGRGWFYQHDARKNVPFFIPSFVRVTLEMITFCQASSPKHNEPHTHTHTQVSDYEEPSVSCVYFCAPLT